MRASSLFRRLIVIVLIVGLTGFLSHPLRGQQDRNAPQSNRRDLAKQLGATIKQLEELQKNDLEAASPENRDKVRADYHKLWSDIAARATASREAIKSTGSADTEKIMDGDLVVVTEAEKQVLTASTSEKTNKLIADLIVRHYKGTTAKLKDADQLAMMRRLLSNVSKDAVPVATVASAARSLNPRMQIVSITRIHPNRANKFVPTTEAQCVAYIIALENKNQALQFFIERAKNNLYLLNVLEVSYAIANHLNPEVSPTDATVKTAKEIAPAKR